jgi:hypothetical protein
MGIADFWRRGPIDDDRLARLSNLSRWRRRLATRNVEVARQVYLWELRADLASHNPTLNPNLRPEHPAPPPVSPDTVTAPVMPLNGRGDHHAGGFPA